jgi:hypothetical protein
MALEAVWSDREEISDADVDVISLSRNGFDMYTHRVSSIAGVPAMGGASVYFITSQILVVDDDDDDDRILSGRSTVTTNIARSKIVELVLRATVSEDCARLLNVIIRTLVYLEEHDDSSAIDVESPHLEKDVLSIYRERVSPCDTRAWAVENETDHPSTTSMTEISDRIWLQLTACGKKTVACTREKTHRDAARKPKGV